MCDCNSSLTLTVWFMPWTMHLVLGMASVWKGPVSVALFARNCSEVEEVLQAISNSKSCFPSVADWVSYALFFDKGQKCNISAAAAASTGEEESTRPRPQPNCIDKRMMRFSGDLGDNKDTLGLQIHGMGQRIALQGRYFANLAARSVLTFEPDPGGDGLRKAAFDWITGLMLGRRPKGGFSGPCPNRDTFFEAVRKETRSYDVPISDADLADFVIGELGQRRFDVILKNFVFGKGVDNGRSISKREAADRKAFARKGKIRRSFSQAIIIPFSGELFPVSIPGEHH